MDASREKPSPRVPSVAIETSVSEPIGTERQPARSCAGRRHDERGGDDAHTDETHRSLTPRGADAPPRRNGSGVAGATSGVPYRRPQALPPKQGEDHAETISNHRGRRGGRHGCGERRGNRRPASGMAGTNSTSNSATRTTPLQTSCYPAAGGGSSEISTRRSARSSAAIGTDWAESMSSTPMPSSPATRSRLLPRRSSWDVA